MLSLYLSVTPLFKKIIGILLLVFLSFFIGIIVSPFLFPQTNSSVLKEIRKSYNYQFINPLLECDSISISQDQNLSSLRKSIEFIINQEISNNNIQFASVYYRDLNNGPWFGINEKEYFSPASLIKVPVMITYLKESEEDPSLLQKKIISNKSFDYSLQNITPTEMLEIDKEYTVEDLINRMIVYSDNGAYELLLDNIDNFKIFKIYKDLDVDISKAQQDPSGNIITVKDYASFYRILFNSSYLNDKNSEKALKILSQTKYYKALTAGVPQNIKVAHKFGERQYLPSLEKQLHDCGIIYLPGKPYLLCVMSRGDDFDKGANFIKQVSKTVYNHLSNQ